MYQLQVEEMTCGHCVSAVTRAVQAVDAAATVEVDLPSKTVRIDSGADLAPIKAAIVDAGFPVTA
ncbi:heavy-metal-associated domain-containing protein [Duganella phyllosphaerae]|uniref:Copper chaperone CopZ n=1 Tax=Duganella phyllosphaerae TaxID=762836 RepID=A0A1E7X602_9BURK|nr:heavy-metal-associated domain-containing protein [Duganella phyllosphaerae]OFA08085.1 copper chaperone CopZ [Duganella phyllosphaerae]